MKKEWIKSLMDDISLSGGRAEHPASRAERACAYDLISLLPFNGDGMTVLDIGKDCEVRFAPLSFLNYRVFGIAPQDVSSDEFDQQAEAATDVEVMRCAFPDQSAPFRDASFDWIVLSNLPESCSQSPATLFSEIRRLMKPTSRMILKSHNPARPLSAAKLGEDLLRGENVGGGRPSKERAVVPKMSACPGELSEGIESNGFRVILRMYRDYGVYCKPPMARYLCRLAKFIMPRLCDTLVTVSTKK